MTFSERPYSMPEIDSATEALMRNDKVFEPLGSRSRLLAASVMMRVKS